MDILKVEELTNEQLNTLKSKVNTESRLANGKDHIRWSALYDIRTRLDAEIQKRATLAKSGIIAELLNL